MSQHLFYFCNKYRLRGIQLVQELRQERKLGENIELRKASGYLKELVL